MRLWGRHITSGTCVALGLSFGLPSLGLAQSGGGQSATLRFSETLRSESGDVTARSDIDFSFSTETRRDRFEINVGSVYDVGLASDEGSNFDDPFANLLYRRENRNTLFQTNASFRRQDIRDFVLLDEIDDTGLVVDEGQREDRQGGLRFDWGREAAFGGSLSADYRSRRFLDVEGGNLQDSDTLNASLRLDFEIDRRITVFTNTTYRDIDRDGGTDTEEFGFSLGADLAVTQTLAASISAGFSDVSESGPGADTNRSGFSANASLSQTLPNGDLTGLLATSIGENGRESSLRVTRNLALQNGDFRAGFGVGEVDGSGRGLFSLGYSRSNRRSNIDFGFDQSFTSSNDGGAVLSSSARMDFRQELSERAGYSVGITYLESDALSSLTASTQQLSVSASYNHVLTDTWSLTGGWSHTRRRTDGGSTTTDDTIFLGLTSVLSWRP